MNYKIIFISILLLVLSVAAVSASDLDNNYVTESSDADGSLQYLEIHSENSDSNEILSANSAPGTFQELQAEINNAPAGSVLNLTRDYNGASGSWIELNKDLTIDGQSHTIDCLGAENCIAFYSGSGNITLKNLRIINGNGNNDNRDGYICIAGSAQYAIENCVFENSLEKGCKAILNNVNKTLTIKNSTFNSIRDDGSGVAVSSIGKAIIKNSVFDSCTGLGDNSCGGALSLTEGGIIEDSIFRNNFAPYFGGAISCNRADLIIIRCLFENNKVDGQIIHDSCGGAISCLFGNLYIYNSTFKDNWADDRGGAIYANNIYINYDQDANQTFNTFFINNVADDINGGAISCSGYLYMKNSVFSSNRAYVDGGAIDAAHDVTMSNCLFESNSADGANSQCYGGAVHSDENVIVDNCTFRDNFAHDYGGAIYANNVYVNTNQANPRAFNSFFINNKASDDKGGAIYAENNVDAVNAAFYGNIAEDSDGGAIYANGVTANNCAFTHNHAENYGGAICSDNLNVIGCLFEYNKADDCGGAVYAESATIYNCTFKNNWADDDGGAVYVDGELSLSYGSSIFESNIAYNGKGGAIYTDRFGRDVRFTSFISNRAGDSGSSGDGGAIYINSGDAVSFVGCYFVNNHCTDEGGAIYLDSYSSKLSLIYNFFVGNGADDKGSVVYSCGSFKTIKNNWWGSDFPLFSNVLYRSEYVWANGYDEDPLKACLTIGATDMSVNYSIPVHIGFVSAFDNMVGPSINGLENIIFESDHLGEFSSYYYGLGGIDAWYTPKEVGTHKISVKNVFEPGKEVVGYVNVDNSSGRQGDTQVITNTDLSFTHFQRMVDDASEGDVIYLTHNFVYYGADIQLNLQQGIKINKTVVIDGQGHSFDAKSKSGILQSSEGHITLRNIIFKNGFQESGDDGGAICCFGKGRFTVINCTFDSNKALQDGGGIYNEGGNLELRDCTFVNNRAEGANRLNDCDGGAVHSKSDTYIRNCVFKNNFANDNGGAIYVTGNLQISDLEPSYFESNTAYKGKGGAIYTNAFTNAVKYASFIGNRAGEGAIISDDGGAIYINDKNEITFESCLFANNNCTDEGGAIYLDSINSKLSLINNVFIGNAAGDEGQAVFNSGYYDVINNNFWGSTNPSSGNDVLIEWKNAFQKNVHHSDKDPLRMDLVLSEQECPVNNTFEGLVHFYKSNGDLFTGDITGIKSVTLSANPRISNMEKNQDKNTVYGKFTPDKEGKYTITADLFGYSVSKSINVFEIGISADEVTTFTNVPVTFKVHLDGDKQHTANQKVKISFFKDYYGVTDDNGDAIVTFDDCLNLDIGRYRVDISSNTFTAQSAVNIITTIFAEDVVQVRGDHVEFKAQFTNNSGDFLKMSTQVQFLLDGNPCYSVIKDNEGNALAEFNSLSRGEHKVVVVNPDNGETKTYRIVILMGSSGNDNGTINQNQETPEDNHNNVNAVEANSLTGDLYYGNSLSNDNGVSKDNGNATNQLGNSPVSKAIDIPQSNSGDNNLWLLILAILAVIAAGCIIKKYEN